MCILLSKFMLKLRLGKGFSLNCVVLWEKTFGLPVAWWRYILMVWYDIYFTLLKCIDVVSLTLMHYFTFCPMMFLPMVVSQKIWLSMLNFQIRSRHITIYYICIVKNHKSNVDRFMFAFINMSNMFRIADFKLFSEWALF